MNALSTPRALLVVIVAAHLIAITIYKIGDALVSQVIAPVSSKLIGDVDLTQLQWNIGGIHEETGNPVAIRYGEFFGNLFGGIITLFLCLLILALILRLFWKRIVKLMGTDSKQEDDQNREK